MMHRATRIYYNQRWGSGAVAGCLAPRVRSDCTEQRSPCRSSERTDQNHELLRTCGVDTKQPNDAPGTPCTSPPRPPYSRKSTQRMSARYDKAYNPEMVSLHAPQKRHIFCLQPCFSA